MPMNIEMFPQAALYLQQEIANHPDLMKRLAMIPPEAALQERFATVLAYCGMVVDGYYNEEAMEKLFVIAIDKLRQKRKIYVN